MPGNIDKMAKEVMACDGGSSADLQTMLQLWLISLNWFKIENFLQKRLIKTPKIFQKSETLEKIAKLRPCVWNRKCEWALLVSALARSDLWLGTYIYLPTLPISTPTQNNSFVCRPKHWRTWGTKTYWGTCRLATFFPSTRAPPVVWCCAMEPRHKKKQRIPFDVSHNFVLLTILKYNVFGCRGRGDKAKRHKWSNQRKCDNKTSNSSYFFDKWQA